MPTGSAASLLRTQQAPLSPLSETRSRTVVPSPLTWNATTPPPRVIPLQKAADDPPRGHVLVIEPDPLAALDLQRLLRDEGYRVVGPAISAEEATRLLDRIRHPMSAALLNSEAADAGLMADRLTARAIPFVWVVPAANAALPSAHAAAPVLQRPFDREEFTEALEQANRQSPRRTVYVTPPPQAVWPRVFPQL